MRQARLAAKLRPLYSRRQLFAKSVVAASRVASQPCVGVRPAWCPKANVHIQSEPTGAALALKMRPTIAPFASTSKGTSSKHVLGLGYSWYRWRPTGGPGPKTCPLPLDRPLAPASLRVRHAAKCWPGNADALAYHQLKKPHEDCGHHVRRHADENSPVWNRQRNGPHVRPPVP
jgi:hypothetical protein